MQILNKEGIEAFFYEEPERFEEVTIKILEAIRSFGYPSAVELAVKELAQEGYKVSRNDVLAVVLELDKNPPGNAATWAAAWHEAVKKQAMEHYDLTSNDED